MVQHLYVMQNCHGFIKIGRSASPDFRRRQLEQSELCDVAIVAVLEGCGDREEATLIALADHRVIGEWFDGDQLTRSAVIRELKLDPATTWPFAPATPKVVGDWLDSLERRRRRSSARKNLGRCALRMELADENERADPHRYTDVNIWSTIWRHEYGVATMVSGKRLRDGREVLNGYRQGFDGLEVLPHYTSVIADAMLLWPDEDRPQDWEGSAWDCCIAALRARRARL